MSARQVGVEEELLLVDPATGRLAAVSSTALSEYERDEAAGDVMVEKELFAQQIETATPPSTDLRQLGESLRTSRRVVSRAAERAGAWAVAASLPPLGQETAQATRDERYGRILGEFRGIARQALVCGTHVHVEVASDEEAVTAVDRLRPWLPLLLAVSANSPLWQGTDTGYASWRTQVWSRWPSAGQTEPFGDPAGYHSALEALVSCGAAIDRAGIYWDVRLAAEQPTVEIRVADVCTDLADVILIAALSRALVETVIRTEPAEPPWRTDLLRAAHWRASRDGVSGHLLHPHTGALVPASEAFETLVAFVRPVLAETGDLDLVAEGLARVQRSGGGAEAQRRALVEHGSYEGVVADLARRTADV